MRRLKILWRCPKYKNSNARLMSNQTAMTTRLKCRMKSQLKWDVSPPSQKSLRHRPSFQSVRKWSKWAASGWENWTLNRNNEGKWCCMSPTSELRGLSSKLVSWKMAICTVVHSWNVLSLKAIFLSATNTSTWVNLSREAQFPSNFPSWWNQTGIWARKNCSGAWMSELSRPRKKIIFYCC